ncbi:MAG: hypothetical protein AAF663_08790, partial [Planctomycetota bacterium]
RPKLPDDLLRRVSLPSHNLTFPECVQICEIISQNLDRFSGGRPLPPQLEHYLRLVMAHGHFASVRDYLVELIRQDRESTCHSLLENESMSMPVEFNHRPQHAAPAASLES